MTNQPLPRDPHRFQPEDQFFADPVKPVTPSLPPSPQPVTPASAPLATPISAQPAAIQPAPVQAAPTTTPTSTVAPVAVLPKPAPEELIWEWKAPSRPHKKRRRQYYTTVAVVLVLIGLILFFAGQFLPIAVLVAGGFLVYVLEVVPPAIVHHSITTYGIHIENKLYYWEDMGRFWYTEKYGQPLLHIEVLDFPYRLTILLGDLHQGDLTELLSEMLIQEQPPLTPLEKAGAWLERMLPLDTDRPKA